ncbi:ester hydrolase C11orf54 homolog [Cataglyphis hispanica]|uniref:ester hydrolase C11orf54 homolog n=1 Tax=Cataglyphis hispanica TaxID=1086592 RepID=UPI00217FF612|nr:ester hydrolase C11orf54 homolog [Cataglyphis hispanica]
MNTKWTDTTIREMFVPENLQDGLRQNFEEATVEWVDCSDLTQEPFNLTAPGLCGNEVLLEIGGISQLFPRPHILFNYDFSEILKGIPFNHTNVLVIGAGISVRSLDLQFGELFVNASFSQVSADSLNINNQSRLAFLDQATGKCALESITDNTLICYSYGNFFISEGKPGKLLKVHAKNCFGLHFLTAMECTLSQYAGDIPSNFVGLGGTFVMKNGIARTHVMPNSWDNQLKTAEDINNWLHYSDLNAPLLAVGTLISENLYYAAYSENTNKILMSKLKN